MRRLIGPPSGSSGEVYVAFETVGHWAVSDIPVVVQYNSSFDPEGIEGSSAAQSAIGTWNGASGHFFEFAFGGETTSEAPTFCVNSPSDGMNIVQITDVLPQGTLGITCNRIMNPSATRQIVEFDMLLNAGTSWSTGGSPAPGKFDLQSVMLHEFGHALGLGHSSVQGAVMWPALFAGVLARTLQNDDLDGLRELYPSAEDPTETPTATGTSTSTSTATSTQTATGTATSTSTASQTATSTRTATATATPSPTAVVTQPPLVRPFRMFAIGVSSGGE
jgi:hypothetical protein